MVNNYFDVNDFDNPIKSFLDDTLFWYIDSDKLKMANVFVMPASTSVADDLFQIG